MAKAGYKDHFGNTIAGFDRINRHNKTKKVDTSLKAQIKEAEAYAALLRKEKEDARNEASATKDEIRFIPAASDKIVKEAIQARVDQKIADDKAKQEAREAKAIAKAKEA